MGGQPGGARSREPSGEMSCRQRLSDRREPRLVRAVRLPRSVTLSLLRPNVPARVAAPAAPANGTPRRGNLVENGGNPQNGGTCESRPNRAIAAGARGVAPAGGGRAAGLRRSAGAGPGPGRLRAAAGGRGTRPRGRAAGGDLAAGHPRASRVEQSGVPHRRPGGRPSAVAGHGGADGGGAHRRRRHPAGRAARAGGGAARRHGRAAGHRTGRPAVRVPRAGAVQRSGGRRHACLRPRQPRRHPHGGGRRARLGAG